MKKSVKPDKFLNEPHFKGGNEGLKAFVAKHLKYPESAIKARVEGDVSLKYDIGRKGKVTAVVVKKSLSPACDAEAIRLVEMLRFDVHVPKGMKAVFHKKITIHFRLPPAKFKMSYTTKKKTIEPLSEEKSVKKIYNYRIVLPK